MSYKIIDAIKKSNLPGRLKRVLEAYASFGNKDGTNIRPSKERVAERGGVSRWTVNRNTDELVEMELLVHDTDENGNRQAYFYGHGHYAFVYHIDVARLQNAPLQSKKQSSKMHRGQRSILRHGNVAKRAATIPGNQTLVYPSVTSVTAESINQVINRAASAAYAAAATNSRNCHCFDEGMTGSRRGRENPKAIAQESVPHEAFSETEIDAAREALSIAWPGMLKGDHLVADMVKALRLLKVYRVEFLDFWVWQSKHPKGKLRPFRSMSHFLKALMSESENSVISQFLDCQVSSEKCRLCTPRKDKFSSEEHAGHQGGKDLLDEYLAEQAAKEDEANVQSR